MSGNNLRVQFYIFLFYFSEVTCQNCREYSQTCTDDKGCCGGCCLNGVCRDIYDDCRLLLNDPCSDVYCLSNEECRIFQPQDCGGCGFITKCMDVGYFENLEDTTTIKLMALANKSKSYQSNICSVLYLTLFLSIIIICY